MARIYMCDRCRKEYGTWSKTFVEVPAFSVFSNMTNVDQPPCCKST